MSMTTKSSLAFAVLFAATIPCLPRAVRAAPSLGGVTPAEGPLGSPPFTITGTELPFRMKVTFVESASVSPRRFRTRIRRHNDVEIVGNVLGKLAPDQAYDVVVTPRSGAEPLVLAAAFTARAPRFTALDTLSAASGEQAVATVDFASKRTRFTVAGRNARVVEDGRRDGRTYRFLVPSRLPAGTTDAAVAAIDGRTRLDAPHTLAILDDRRKVTAQINRARFASWQQGFDATTNLLVITGGTSVSRGGRSDGSFLTIRVPVDLATATLPVTVTEADGGSVEWFSSRVGGGLLGPKGRYSGGTFSVTVEFFDGTTLFGTFDARLDDMTQIGPRRRDLLIPSGQFAVDRNP